MLGRINISYYSCQLHKLLHDYFFWECTKSSCIGKYDVCNASVLFHERTTVENMKVRKSPQSRNWDQLQRILVDYVSPFSTHKSESHDLISNSSSDGDYLHFRIRNGDLKENAEWNSFALTNVDGLHSGFTCYQDTVASLIITESVHTPILKAIDRFCQRSVTSIACEVTKYMCSGTCQVIFAVAKVHRRSWSGAPGNTRFRAFRLQGGHSSGPA